MKRLIIAALSAFAFLFVSCQKEPVFEEEPVVKVTLKALIQNEDTKVTLDRSERTLHWVDGDLVSINGVAYAASVSSSDDQSAEFSDVTESATGYRAYYPSTLEVGGKAVLPSSITYSADEFRMPMYASIADASEVFHFKNICGVLALKVKAIGDHNEVHSISVSSSDRAMSGPFTVEGGKAVVSSDATGSISVVCPTAVTVDATGTEFFVPIPEYDYQNFLICVNWADGTSMYMKSKSTFSIKRNVFYTVNFKDTGYVPEAVSILDGRRWSYTNMDNIVGAMQGAAETGGVIYQFSYSGSGANSTTPYSTYDIATGVWTKHDALTCAPYLHAGSATFSPNLVSTYTVDGETKTTTVPFIYLTGHYNVLVDGKTSKHILIDVIDVVNDVLVKRYTFPDLTDDSIAAYDFESGKVWLLGYRTVKDGKAPYFIREFNVDLNSVAPAKTNFTLSDIVSEVEVGGPDTADGIQKDLNCGTLQDAFYKNGYVYFITGRGSDYHRTEWTKIHSYNTLTKTLENVYICPDEQEAQGLTIYGNDIYMTVSGNGSVSIGKRLWKFSLGSGYDSYNFEPATKTGEGTYSIANASQFVWFKSQVYGGCTSLKAELTNDLDMMGVSDPFTFYVHEYPDETKTGENRKYESQYAFRGEFDGKGHTIRNISIKKTPYYNVGLFPYVIGGTIKDFTAKGTVTLTTPLSVRDSLLKKTVESVGLIGTLDGGSVSNVNSADFSVIVSDGLTLANENGVATLVGHVVEDSGAVLENNTTSNGSHAESGDAHKYVNGVCVYSDCEDRFEEPEVVDGVYQISNAGNLWWFANYVNGQEVDETTNLKYVYANAALTKDINMDGADYGSFPGIGESEKIYYSGVFDGQGHTIENFYTEITSNFRRGLFNNVKGQDNTDRKAIVKNFTLKGNVIVNVTSGMYGSVVGDLKDFSLLEDVTSSVTVTTKVLAPYVGGVAGAVTGGSTMNRCRFNGVLNSGTAVKGIGGLAGEVRGGTITNSLFDGTINASSTSADLILGGIAGRNEQGGAATITYCFSNGTINLAGSSYAKVGAVLGSTTQGSTFVNTYYTTDGMSTSKFGVGNAGGVVTGSPNDITGSEDIYSGELHFQLGETNWLQTDFTEGHYPIPGPGGQHVHVFDADGFCRANDGEYQEPSLVDGYYEISNAGELFWFATKVNSGSKSIKAKLVSDIDMLGTKYIWPVIGSSTSNVFSGTFDGNNKRIKNFNLPVANGQSRRGFIGIATGATIKNFTISGMMNCAATADTYFLGAVVGQADGSTKIEGVTSDVDIVVSGGKERHVGGIVGVAGMATNSAVTIDRCRYSGNISVTTSYSGSVRASIGGICGNLRGAKINNSLFDGSITATATTTNTGGIVGAVSDQAPGSQLNNCFVNGSFSIADNTNNLNGSVIGTIVAVVTITNSYYVGTHTPVGSSTATLTGSATNVEGSTITDGTLLNSLGTDNWEAGTAGYPVPKMK